MFDDRRDLCSQLDRIMESKPELIWETLESFQAEDPDSARVVRHWTESNNARLSAIRQTELSKTVKG